MDVKSKQLELTTLLSKPAEVKIDEELALNGYQMVQNHLTQFVTYSLNKELWKNSIMQNKVSNERQYGGIDISRCESSC